MEGITRISYRFKDKIKNYVEYDYDTTKPDQLVAEGTCDYYGFHAKIKVYSFGEKDGVGKYYHRSVVTFKKHNTNYTLNNYDTSNDEECMKVIEKNNLDVSITRLIIISDADCGYCYYKSKR